jgi:hypothetical protein
VTSCGGRTGDDGDRMFETGARWLSLSLSDLNAFLMYLDILIVQEQIGMSMRKRCCDKEVEKVQRMSQLYVCALEVEVKEK